MLSRIRVPLAGWLKPQDTFDLWIYIRSWEPQRCSTPALRDELRAIWQRAGHATAVEL